MKDMQGQYYADPACQEVSHNYEHPNLHILADLGLWNLLAVLCAATGNHCANQHQFEQLLKMIYTIFTNKLLGLVLPTVCGKVETRMCAVLERGGKGVLPAILESEAFLCPTPIVFVGLARAGIPAAEACHDVAGMMFGWDKVRKDYVFAERRKADGRPGTDGTEVKGFKIGGSVEGAIVIFPDPMGATGGSLSAAITGYLNECEKRHLGTPLEVIAMPLIITPEFVVNMDADHPDVSVYALRLDRGNSTPLALSAVPGTYPEQEFGLTETDYIVPGGGGFGELLNNAQH